MTRSIYVERWHLLHRLQHGTLALSMFGLLGTGLPIKYAYTAWAGEVFGLLGGFHNTLIIHKASALLLCLVTVWHVIYLAAARLKGGPARWEMMMNGKDLRDAVHHGAYLLGLRQQPPQYDRYTYLEKFEYLAIIWGLVVMGGSGMAVWFPEVAASWFPRWVLDGLRIVHSNEAFVAMLSLAFGHFFVAHFSPLIFPSSTVWLTGKISAAHLKEEHPLEYQRLVEAGKLPADAAPEHRHRLAGWRRAVGVAEMLIYSVIFYGLLITFIPLLLV